MEGTIKRRLKRYCHKEENIILAFIFGSAARGFECPNSDLDIGVYLKDKNVEDRVWREISKITNQDVDLILLNNAPATLLSNIFKTGILLTKKDKRLYWDLYLRQTLEAEDFYEFIRDYWKIYLRSSSLISEDKVRLIERLQFLKSEFQEIEEFRKQTFKEYSEDKTKRRNLERWTENIINATIDIAKIILASSKKEIPRSYEYALFNFGVLIGLEEEQAQKFSTFARLRNILAHEYLDIIYDKVREFINDSSLIYEKVFDFLSKYI